MSPELAHQRVFGLLSIACQVWWPLPVWVDWAVTLTKIALAGGVPSFVPKAEPWFLFFFSRFGWDLRNSIGAGVRSHVGRVIDFTAGPEGSAGDKTEVFFALNDLIKVA